ncbi:MAG: isoprenyl transferase [Deltaproteobacteria bacterium]|nr:isoprenyl transferase [Deltaproteobacteria bacterium]
MLEKLDQEKLPRHLAIIMDGNGRWAQKRGLSRLDGHRAGAESVRKITRACRRLGMKYLTLYAFSQENWQRPRPEVEGLMKLLSRYLMNELMEMLENGIRLNTIGDMDRLPAAVADLLKETMVRTSSNKEMVLTLALSYSGRLEIIRACRKLAEECLAGRLTPDRIDETSFTMNLFDPDLPNPDLLIRTSGERRISNFLLWQIAYSEFYTTQTHWPEFDENELYAALWDYQQRQRRFGLTGEQVEVG